MFNDHKIINLPLLALRVIDIFKSGRLRRDITGLFNRERVVIDSQIQINIE